MSPKTIFLDIETLKNRPNILDLKLEFPEYHFTNLELSLDQFKSDFNRLTNITMTESIQNIPDNTPVHHTTLDFMVK